MSQAGGADGCIVTAYREDMLAQVGIALFLFGNEKNDAGKIILADGIDQLGFLVQKK